MNVSCNSEMNDLLDDINFFISDDVNVRIYPVSKMPFRKKPRDSMLVRSKSNSSKSLPRTVHKWLPKLQPLAEPVAKLFPRVKRQIDKISKTPNSSGRIYKWQYVFAVIAGYGEEVSFFIKDHVEKGTIELYFVGTEYRLADLFTKSLPEARFKFLVEKLGMMSRET
nr:retrovirus-related Pol polyprotein from transposon TNT 1-94 [Tanacetum cinerariifolium]